MLENKSKGKKNEIVSFCSSFWTLVSAAQNKRSTIKNNKVKISAKTRRGKKELLILENFLFCFIKITGAKKEPFGN